MKAMGLVLAMGVATLAYIIEDYEKKGWVIPTDWMTMGCAHPH